MSDSKRPGSRDISDLKARLGLKKGPAQPAESKGVAPPPGVGLTAPPGMRAPAPTQPPQPAVPNAADDPFAAMNAMAQMGTAQRAPEIIIVNDGKPVENVSGAKRGTQIAKLAGLALVPLIVGAIVGKIGTGAAYHNQGVRGAKALLTNMKQVKKDLNGIKNLITDTATRGGLGPDKQLTTALETEWPKIEVKSDVYRALHGSFPPDLSGQVMSFYAGAAEVHALLREHINAAKVDDVAFVGAAKAGEDAKLKETENAAMAGRLRYGVVVNGPGEGDPGTPFGARVVEIGPPMCGGGKVATGGSCADGITGFTYRGDGGAWNKADLAQPGSTVALKTMLEIVPNQVSAGLVRGNERTAAEFAYTKRLEMLLGRLDELIKSANSTEAKLNTRANAGEKFTFFM